MDTGIGRIRPARLHDVIVLPRQQDDAETLDQARESVEELGGTFTRDLKHADGFVASLPETAIEKLQAQGLAVVEDKPLQILPDSSRFGNHKATAQNALGPTEGLYSGLNYTGKGVGIAILDSGVANHPDLQGRIIGFADAVDGSRRPVDPFGHGTHVAGDAAGDGAMSGGRFKGPAPEANIIGIRVIGDQAGDRLSDAVDGIVSGIHWMIQNKERYNIRVANLSLGLPLIPARPDFFGRPTALYDPIGQAINQAVAAGICVVAAAGNSGQAGPGSIQESPAINDNVITVGALDNGGTPTPYDDSVADFSSRGPTPTGATKPDILAPGVNVMSLNSPGSDLEQMNLQAAQMKQMVAQMSDRQVHNMAMRMVMVGMAPPQILEVHPSQLREALYESVQTHPMAGRLANGAAYIGMDGTSMASPIVAGVVAAMIEANPALQPNDVKAILMRTAEPLRGAGPNSQGAGVINPQAAVQLAERMNAYPSGRYAAAPQEQPQPDRRGWLDRIFG